MIDDALWNRDMKKSRPSRAVKVPGKATNVCQGCGGKPGKYFSLVGEVCGACRGTGQRRG